MFKIGQMVRVIDNGRFLPHHRHLIGHVGRIIGPMQCNPAWVNGPAWPVEGVRVEHTGGLISGSALVPVDDDADYKRFMERVMKPVDLGQPVSA